jgi:hypothetical protein
MYKAKTKGETTSIGFDIQSSVLDYVRDGKAILNATLGKQGMEAWVQFLDPDVVHRTFDLESASEYIQEQGRGKGKAVEQTQAKPKSALKASVEDLEVELANMSVERRGPKVTFSTSDRAGGIASRAIRMDIDEARMRVEGKKLMFHRIRGVLNKYPLKSLVANDFKRVDDLDFVARATCIADAVGTSRMINRLATDPAFRINGVKTLSEWWERASQEQKLLSLTAAKDIQLSSVPNKQRIDLVGFPFQEAGLDQGTDEESGWSG